MIMLLSVGSMTLLFAWCLYRVLASPKSADNSREHGPENPA